jgi:hypothetical protein
MLQGKVRELHSGVLTPAGVLRPDARTLVVIHTSDFCDGYRRGRLDHFTRYEQIIHTEDELLDLLTGHAEDHLYLSRKQDTLRWAPGYTVGELSGRLYPLTQPEQRYLHATSQVKPVTVLQEM